MDLGIKRPGLLGGPVERTAHRPRFGASPSLPCSSVTKKRTKCHTTVFFLWVPELGVGVAPVMVIPGAPRRSGRPKPLGIRGLRKLEHHKSI